MYQWRVKSNLFFQNCVITQFKRRNVMTRINFITNQDINNTSGGWSGISFNIYRNLLHYLDVHYVGPVNPPMQLYPKVISKLTRTMGGRGNFVFFSENRLNAIFSLVSKRSVNSTYNFFFGQTPWINCEYKTPYGVYMDADVYTYLKIYSDPQQFSKKDIQRIMRKEEKWLQKASHIFVGSQWTWNEMVKYYDLRENQKVIVHTGGNIELPEKDLYRGKLNFIFISLNFKKKGGFLCVEILQQIRKKYPNASLTIVGDSPPKSICQLEGVNYVGFLRKTEVEERKKIENILSSAFLLIHPTTMDTMGAVLIEAGYFGCPSIAPRSFGIPELVLDNHTGFIIETPFNSSDFVDRINYLIENQQQYLEMRQAVWNHTRSKMTWLKICETINYHVVNG